MKDFGAFVNFGNIYFSCEKDPVCSVKDLKIYGEHNISNALAAITVAKLQGISVTAIKKVISKFFGVANRQELVAEKRGVKYFNDTTATMPQAAIQAIKTFVLRFPEAKIILIAGGQDKNLSYEDLARIIQEKIGILVLLPGTASEKIKTALAMLAPDRNVETQEVESMEEAVSAASKLAKFGDIVLLSPGAASFNLFTNEFDRGEKFIRAVKKIKNAR